MSNQHGYMKVADAALYYEINGKPDGWPLVMLHGGLGSSADLQPLQQYLSANYKLISIDLRGHGKSTLGQSALSYWQHQQDVQAVLQRLDIQRYALFGFSDGGIVAYRLAATQPANVSCLFTLGAQWRLVDGDPAIELLTGVSAEFWRANFADDVDYYETNNPAADFAKLVSAVKTSWLDTSATGYPAQLVKQIQCPTLVMRGDKDFLFSLLEAVALTKEIADSHFANLPLCSHAAHLEAPELVGKMLARFVMQCQL